MKDKKDLYTLLHHLRNCPPEFPQLTNELGLMNYTVALIYDVYRGIYGDFTVPHDKLPSLNDFSWRYYGENECRSIQIGTWFFTYPLFQNQPSLAEGIKTFLLNKLPALSVFVNYQQWLDDEDRAEEFVREALQCCDILIDGETLEEAQDRLDALSTLKRQKVLKETNESMERMKAIRQKMAEQKAREAANVYGRE